MNLSDTTPSTLAALDAGSGKMAKTAGYYAAFVALGLTSASLGPTLPGLAAQTQAHLSEVSFLFTARSLGYLLGSLAGGRLYDRVAGHPLMGWAIIVLAVALALVPGMPLLWLLTALLLFIGLLEGGLDVGGNTLLVWVHGHEVGPFMNGLHFFFGLGAFLSPIIVAQAILRSGNIAWAYWVLALLVLPVAFWLLRQPSPAAQVASKENPAGQIKVGLVGLIVLFFFLYVGAEVSAGGWIYTYALNLAGAAETTAAYLTSAFWGALTVGRLLSIPIAARVRPRYILLSDMLGCLVSVGIMVAWPGSLLAIWLGTLGLGLSMASVFPTTLSLAERRMTITGQITGWFFCGASVGGMTLPWLIGQLFEAIGPQVVMQAILIDLFLATAVFGVLITHSTRMVKNEH